MGHRGFYGGDDRSLREKSAGGGERGAESDEAFNQTRPLGSRTVSDEFLAVIVQEAAKLRARDEVELSHHRDLPDGMEHLVRQRLVRFRPSGLGHPADRLRGQGVGRIPQQDPEFLHQHQGRNLVGEIPVELEGRGGEVGGSFHSSLSIFLTGPACLGCPFRPRER